MVRADRIELTSPVWKTEVLPLNYARVKLKSYIILIFSNTSRTFLKKIAGKGLSEKYAINA